MTEPYIAEIRMMSFNFPPTGWALCNGQLLSINQNQALFSLIGTTYGGNGVQTFALPNLQGLVALHTGSGYVMGQTSGETSHQLLISELPAHTHTVSATATDAPASAAGRVPDATKVLAEAHSVPAGGGATIPVNMYGAGAVNQAMSSQAIGTQGSNQPHPNQQPYLVLNYCIALQGIFPTRN